MDKTITQPVSLTSGAISEIKSLISSGDIPENQALRLGVKNGGCSGFTYIIGFDDMKDTDDLFEIGGLKIVIQKSHLMYLQGIELDYQNGLQNRGFVLNN